MFAAAILVPAAAAGCARGGDQVAETVIEVVTAAPQSPSSPQAPASQSPSSAPASSPGAVPAGAARLIEEYDEFAGSLDSPVGVAIVPVGGGAEPILLGDQTPMVAWSTIKVPLALAAERKNGPSSAENAAIVNSDNSSAEELWASLGTNAEASAAVTAVLREGGDEHSDVPAQQLRPPYTIFGQTVWKLGDAATFTANLPCLPGSEQVVDLMGQVSGNQQWGVEVMRSPKSTAVKGGWGPGAQSGYDVRQIGLVTFRNGDRVAIAMATNAAGSSMDGGTGQLNSVARWLNQRLELLPRGSCG